MSEHPIHGLMNAAMENLKQMVDVNTIIGDPVETPDGSVILTVSKVGFGFGAGGSEFPGTAPGSAPTANSTGQQQRMPFGGGSGGGVSITPIAFLIVNSSGVKLLHLDENTHLLDKILDLAPAAMEKIQSMIGKKDKDKGIDIQANDNAADFNTQ
ncbi:GerW family sporulation protein [Bacillus sp. AGMB 02131]|uniref:GerW family sporulation protein n=1 Tax=Peribacillus faecalis TaxID=2772559 RepID=A0A927HCW4_9BACI|nr:GerW family sporulation protein [Peribacillus faecalis]MBD3110469.1 GerW family sporulation protein [Peribacillus faecalis]